MDETAGEGQLVEDETRPQENLSSMDSRSADWMVKELGEGDFYG